MAERTLYRSRDDRMIAGVAGGLADYFGIDPTVVRIGIVLLALVSNGAVLVAYIIMAVVVPEEPLPEAAPVAAAGPPQDVPEAEGMGPGDLPEPGEFGTTPVPDPAEGVAPRVAAPAPHQPQPSARPGSGGVVLGLILIGVGVLFLLQRVADINLLQLWPLVLIAIGIATMFGRGR